LTSALEGGEGSASRLGRTLPLGKTQYPLYGRPPGFLTLEIYTFCPHSVFVCFVFIWEQTAIIIIIIIIIIAVFTGWFL